jgi:hypothetical protein
MLKKFAKSKMVTGHEVGSYKKSLRVKFYEIMPRNGFHDLIMVLSCSEGTL